MGFAALYRGSLNLAWKADLVLRSRFDVEIE
jgi:hypothetical protein